MMAKALLRGLSERDAAHLLYDWTLWARDKQLPPVGDWRVWLILAGRGFGKTRTGAEWIRGLAESGRAGRIALVGETAADARDVMIEGESGLLACCPPWARPRYEPSKRRITWSNGAIATCFSADDPDQLRGPQFDTAWADEVAKWRHEAAWDNWGGRFDASEAETYGAQAINTFDDVIRARYLRIDFDDPDNAAGFLQAGRLVAAPAWQPSVNFQYGWSLEQVDQSEVKRSRGGQAYVNARPRFRRLQFTIDHLEKDEMFGHAYELERLKGKGGDIMVIADAEDLTHTQRHAVYGALTESAPIFNMQPGRYRRRFIVEELL